MPGPISVTPAPTKGITQLAMDYENLTSEPVILNRYMPNIKEITSTGIGNLTKPTFTQDNIFSRFTMLPGSHTAESCAMNAGLISANQQYNNQMDILSGAISVNKGFFIEIYNDYFWDDISFFSRTSPVWTSFSNASKPSFAVSYDAPICPGGGKLKDKFGNQNGIEEITNGQITIGAKCDKNNTSGLLDIGNQYSIRLTGVFDFNQIGVWTFSTTSDDSSVVWIGDTAIIGTSKDNINLNNDGGHGMRTIVFQYECKKIGEQPIRIMMGNGGGPSGLIIQYKRNDWPSYSTSADYTLNDKTVTYIKNYTRDGKPIYNNVFYALLGDAKTSQLNCAIYGKVPHQPDMTGYSAQQGFLQASLTSMDNNYLLDNINDAKETVVWEIINPKAKIFTPSSTYNLVGVWSQEIGPGSLVVNTPSGGIVGNGIVSITYTTNNVFKESTSTTYPNGKPLSSKDAYTLSKPSADVDPNKDVKQYIANYPDIQAWFNAAVSQGGYNVKVGGYAPWGEHYAVYGVNEGRQFTNTYSATIESDGNFYVKDGYGNAIWSLVVLPNTSDSESKTLPNVQRISTETFTNEIVAKAQVNTKWLKEINEGRASDTLYFNQTMTNGYNNQAGIRYLIDKSGKYKIQVSESGNLVYVITKKIKSRKFDENNNSYKYTTYDDNSAYLYKVDAPSVLAKTFETKTGPNGENPILHRVDTTSKLFSYSSDSNKMNYVKYPSYYPSGTNIDKDSKIKQEDCEAKCTSDADCMYYYSYVNNGTDYCQTSGKNDHITFATSSDKNNSKSDLYVKNPNILFNALLSDPYDTKTKLSNNATIQGFQGYRESFVDNKSSLPPISNIPSSLNGKEQIVDPNTRQYLHDLQRSLVGSASKIKAGGQIGDKTATGTVESTMTAKDPKSAGSTMAAAAEGTTVAVASTNSSATQSKTSNQLGNDGFTPRIIEGLEEETRIDIKDLNKLLPVSSQSIPERPANVASIGPLGMPSTLSFEKDTGIATPKPRPPPEEMLKKDLFLNHMTPTTYKLESVVKPTSKGNFKMKNSGTNTKVDNVGSFINNDHVDGGYDWQNAYYPPTSNGKSSRDIINDDANTFNASYLNLKNGYTPPSLTTRCDHEDKGITFSFWVCSSYNKIYSRILDFGDEMNSGGHQIVIAYVFDSLVFLVSNWPYSCTFAWLGQVNFNDWTHIIWTLTPDGKWEIYANGALVINQYAASLGWNKTTNEHNLSGSGATYPDPTYLLKNCYIGKSNWWWDPFFNGKMSDLRIYNAKLSRPEIINLYNNSYLNYNTNPAKVSINRGIYFLSHFSLNSKYHWYLDWYTGQCRSISRSNDGTTGIINDSYLWTPNSGTVYLFTSDDKVVLSSKPKNHPIQKDTTISHGYCLKLDGKHYAQIFTGNFGQTYSNITLPKITTSSTGIKTGGMAISVWVKADAGANNSSTSCTPNNWRRIMDFGNGAWAQNIVLALNNGKLAFWVIDNNGTLSTMGPEWGTEYQSATSVTIADSKWHHIVWVIEPSPTQGRYRWRVYIDNIYYPIDHDFIGYVSTMPLSKCYIGKSNWGCEGLLIASICDFRIYSKTLNAGEVSALYSIGNMSSTSGNEAFTNKSIEGFSKTNILGRDDKYTSYQEGYTTPSPSRAPYADFTAYQYQTGTDPNIVAAGTKNDVIIPGSSVDFNYYDLIRNTYAIDSQTQKYNTLNTRTNKLRVDLSNIITKDYDLYDILHTNTKYDFTGDTVAILNPDYLNTTQNVLKNDVHELILQENTVYTVGVITFATLLIGALLISNRG
jgi:hypothetical protein